MKSIVAILAIAMCVTLATASNQGVFQSATRRVMDLFSLAQKQNYLIVTADMRDQFVPGNVRAVDLAKTLRGDGHSVTIVSKNGAFAPEFSAQLKATGVEMHSVATEPHFFTDSLLKARKFDAAFLYLWFWGNDLSVPQTYIPAIRAASANTKIVVVTDDAHTERAARLNTVNQVLSTPVTISDALPRDGELSIYEQADAVMTVSEADTMLLEAQLKSLNVPVVTAHWGHQLSSLAIPTEVAAFERRSGVVFVGYGKNPSNQIGLQWFFEKVFPQLKGQLANERFYIVGDAPADGYASLAKSGAHIIPMSQRDDASMRTILASARVMIAPIFSTGLTTKVLLGMSNGIPVVATRMAAAGYQWAGQEAEFASAMMVAQNAQQFADAVALLSTNSAEWVKYSNGGLKLARIQTSPARFASDVRALVGQVKVRAAGTPSSAFVAPSALRAAELKLKSQNPFELMAGTGGSSSSGPGPMDCDANDVGAKGKGLFVACECNLETCLSSALVCTPSTKCSTAQTALLSCKDSKVVQGTPTYKGLVDKYYQVKQACPSSTGDASPSAACTAALAAAGAGLAFNLL
jgi:glycosyltransferase involved in cell wall biosynthesis